MSSRKLASALLFKLGNTDVANYKDKFRQIPKKRHDLQRSRKPCPDQGSMTVDIQTRRLNSRIDDGTLCAKSLVRTAELEEDSR